MTPAALTGGEPGADASAWSLPDSQLAADLATRAGELLLAVRRRLATAPVRERRDAGDREAHALLAACLAEQRPGDAVLSEEGDHDPRTLRGERVWIVDPLDGTTEFGEPGRTDWAVHVALWQRGVLVAGAVALPALGQTYATPHVPLAPPPSGAPRVVVSRSRPPDAAQAVCTAIGGTTLVMGSAGAKAMAVVRGAAHVYLHAGQLHEWDSAAPVAVARAAGLHVSRWDGSPVRYAATAQVRQPDLLVCRPELAATVLAALPRGPA